MTSGTWPADRPAPGAAAARTARGADRRARAAAEPSLRDADADVDPLPLHGRGAAGAVRRRGSRRGAPAAALRVGAPAGGAGRRRLDVPRGSAPRPASRLARRAARLRPRDARARRRAHARVAARAVAVIPPDAPVSATNTLGAHLSERRRVFSFPVLGDASWVAVDETRPSYRDQADAPDPFAVAFAGCGRAGASAGVRRGRDRRAPSQRGIVCGSRYAVSASAASRATRSSSSGAASGTAHARYQTAR